MKRRPRYSLTVDNSALGWIAGDQIHIGGDPTPYRIVSVANNTITYEPMGWWQFFLDLLSVFD